MESTYESHPDEAIFGGYRFDGLYAFGPKGTHCALAVLLAFTFCAVSAATPDGERRRKVVYRGRESERRRDRDEEPAPPRTTWLGQFPGPTKSPNSGRKRKAA